MAILERVRAVLATWSRERRWFMGWVGVAILGLGCLAVPGPRAGKAGWRLAEAHAAGRAGGTVDYVAHWVPRAALGGLGVALVLLVGARWLVRPVPEEGPTLPRPGGRSRAALVGVTGLAILYSAVANGPRLSFSLWGDEESTLRKNVVGQYERAADGRLALDRVTWTETLFRYRDPNNHPLNSVLARLSHEVLAGGLRRADGFYFDERAMRWPVFGAGLLGLGALGWLGWVLGRPLVGGLAVLLMAGHPWFIRYGVEARGYGLLLLFTPLALGSLVRAVETGRWRWWIGYGWGQFFILWSYPGALHLVVALNVSAAALVFGLRGPTRAWRQAQAGRWVTACALGAVMSALLLLPCVQPLLFYLKTARMQGPMPSAWYADAVAWLFTGMPWRPWDGGNPRCWSWEQVLGSGRVLGAGVALAGLVGAAVWGWWRQGGVCRALLPGLLLQAPLFVLQAEATRGFIYAWYLFPALVGVMLLLGGVVLVGSRVAAGGLAVGLAWAWGAMQPARQSLRDYPSEQMREGTRLTRQITLPSDPRIDEVITVDVLMTTRAYDPAVRPLESDEPEAFRKYLREADVGRKPLYVHFGSPGLAEAVRPGVMALVRNPALFEEVATLLGQDAAYTRQVFRYRAGSVDK